MWNFTSFPVTVPSPRDPVLIVSASSTEFWAVKRLLTTSAWKLSSPAAESRFSISSSAGELTRGHLGGAEGGRPGGAAHVRVVGEDAIDRDEDVAHVPKGSAAGKQSREGGMPDHSFRREDEIIGRFKLDLVVVAVGRFADGRDPAVRDAGAEGEGRRHEARL